MQNALILIIDQSSATRQMYADYLRHHGYRVVGASDSAEGLRLSRSMRPELIVTELAADREWIQAIQVMKRNGTARETAIIACSTFIDPRWPCVPDDVAVDRALPKPTAPRDLLREIERLLGEPALEPAVA